MSTGRPRIYVATANAGKLGEMQALFAPAGIELATYPDYVSPVEGERSYVENAALKARALRAQLAAAAADALVLADDSGLEVRALGGRPGVTTADYGGAGAGWPERRRMLLAELSAVTDRAARFVCALHAIDADGREFGTFATVEGTIAAAEAGELGFSFDPVFYYPPERKTFAQLDPAQKNRVSHRAVAVAGLLAALDAARGAGVGAGHRSRGPATRERE